MTMTVVMVVVVIVVAVTMFGSSTVRVLEVLYNRTCVEGDRNVSSDRM